MGQQEELEVGDPAAVKEQDQNPHEQEVGLGDVINRSGSFG